MGLKLPLAEGERPDAMAVSKTVIGVFSSIEGSNPLPLRCRAESGLALAFTGGSSA